MATRRLFAFTPGSNPENAFNENALFPENTLSSIVNPSDVNLEVELGRLKLANPIAVASGTFGYAREMADKLDLSRLGAILPKTITQEPRPGNPPPRTHETASGLLNSIGLDNDGIEAFIRRQMPLMADLDSAIIVSIAGRSIEQYGEMAQRLDEVPGVAALELNISCPNVSGGVDFGTNPKMCEAVVEAVRAKCSLPVLSKLTPNVTAITEIAKAAEAGGADVISLTNTCLGMAVDWRRRRPILGNKVGGLSGPAIKPISLRCVYQVAAAVDVPLMGIGGIENIDDVMQFIVAGATAVQIGTANFYKPNASMDILDALPGAVAELGAGSVAEVVGTIER